MSLGWDEVSSLHGPVDGGYWGSLPARNSSADWIEKPRQLADKLGVLLYYGCPRGCGVPLSGCLLTSWSSLYCSKLFFRVPLRFQELQSYYSRPLWIFFSEECEEF